ncbi:hypothetical protein [Bacillus smithii]|uniref:hypothetical protein n=1 Tax=Bacillus smithii TaxID=1479 RepID=UPI003D1D302B
MITIMSDNLTDLAFYSLYMSFVLHFVFALTLHWIVKYSSKKTCYTIAERTTQETVLLSIKQNTILPAVRFVSWLPKSVCRKESARDNEDHYIPSLSAASVWNFSY